MKAKSRLLLGGAMGIFVFATGAQAQATKDAPATESVAKRNDAIETVVVTARKRAEPAQQTPLAVTAVNADQIAKLFVHDLADLDHQAPNFTIEGVGAIHRNAAVIYSRGIGYGNVDQGQDPAVGVSVNGVFATRNIGMLSNTQDVEHIEILRGPQGTLFGKNTVGGVVNVTTKKPGDELELEAMARVGNLGRFDYFGAIDVPVNDTLAFRLSFTSQDSTGPFTNAYTGPVQPLRPPYQRFNTLPKHLGGDNIKTIRGTAVWSPVSAFEADLVVSYLKDRSPSVGGQNGSTPTDVLFFFGHPGYDYRTPGQPYPLGPNPPYTVHRNFPSADYQDSTTVSLNARYHADGFDIVSVTGFIHDSNLSLNDYDGTELNFFESTYALHNDQFSEELRLESANETSPLKWVVGGIFTGRNWGADQVFYSMFAALDNHEDTAKQADDSWAAFGQADYFILPELELSAGLRFTAEAKDITRVPSHLATGPAPAPFFFHKVWSNVSFHLGADYHIDEDKLIYASYSTGFVAGGFNTRVDTALLTGLPYAPEHVVAWEIGLKSDWYEHHLRVNLAAFTNKYSQLQVGAFIPGGGLQQAIVNNAFERANGIELETIAVPIENLTLSASVGLLDAHYTSFVADVFGTGVADFSFLRPARAPKWTARFEAGYDFDLWGKGTLSPDAAYALESSHFTDLTNSPVGFQPTYGLWSASLNYRAPSGRWGVSLWGKNLGNVVHRLSAVPSSGYFTQLYFDNPRTIGADLTLKTGL